MSKAIKYILLNVFFVLTSILQAQEDCNPDPCCPPPCPPKDPCAKCAQLWPTCGPDWIVTPNAGPCVSSGADLFLTAEFLYWTARQDGLEFAFTNNVTQSTTSTHSEKGKIFHPDWRMEPGFKIGLGIFFDCDGWDLYANYTWLRTRNTDETALPKDLKILRPLIFSTEDIDHIKITSDWKHDFSVIDLELGRNFFISQCLHLRPHFGLKGTWQKQKWDVVDTGIDSIQSTLITFADLDLDYWGIGIRTGLDSAWHFTPCFSLLGEVAIAALWERFDSETKIFTHDITAGSFVVELFIENAFHSIHSVLELYLGLRFENWFCCNEYHWSIEGGK
ncbi:MAG: hypothetical protein K1000chlam3_00494 [Chlamydiae bacterium]|nr:hypothetical protein [Chlamydiota bacterium]